MSIHRSRHQVRRVALAAAGVLVLAGLAACGNSEEATIACPDVRLDRDTATLTKFRPGPGRDITDILYEAEITGYSGDCGYSDDGSTVNMLMKVEFAVTRGPAMEGDQGEFPYFVAVPAFFPAPQAKQVLPVTFRIPSEGNVTTARLRDEEVAIDIPLPDGVDPGQTPVYVGFQLTAEELEYNRRRR